MKNFLKGIAAKLRNRKTDDIKIGTIAEVIDPRCCHFNYGEIVMLKSIDAEDKICPYYFMNNHGLVQCLRRDEFRVAGETAKNPINRAYVFITIFLAACCLTILFVPVDTAADIAKILLVVSLGIGIGVALIMVIDPSTNEFCKSIDDANSLTENEDEWLGM